jgi:hypothetical protein
VIDYSFVVDLCRSTWPNVQILCIGGMSTSEQWLTGPNRLSSGTSTSYIDANIAAICAARPGWTEYCALTPWFLAQEMVLNTPSPGVTQGIMTNDGVHPNLVGQVGMGGQAFAHFTFPP